MWCCRWGLGSGKLIAATQLSEPPSPSHCCSYNLAHRGYTSEGPGGHAACPFDFYKTWAATPEKTRALSEALTRDAGGAEGHMHVCLYG